MRNIVDLRSAAPVWKGGWRYAAAQNRPAHAAPPPGAVVMRKVRKGWTVEGRRFADADEAMAYTDRLATEQRRRVWIATNT